jgi:hypothetical protein
MLDPRSNLSFLERWNAGLSYLRALHVPGIFNGS